MSGAACGVQRACALRVPSKMLTFSTSFIGHRQILAILMFLNVYFKAFFARKIILNVD
jgi:hypothetical protein